MIVQPAEDSTLTIFNIPNLHCISCVTTINHCILKLFPPPSSFEVSIAHQSVAVNHPKTLPASTIQSTLRDEGFEITFRNASPLSAPLHTSSPLTGDPSRHLEHCNYCRELRTKERTGLDVPITVEQDLGPFAVTLSVGGMTCSACVNTVTDNVSRLSGVSDVVVNLLEASAVTIVKSRDLVDTVRSTIEDCGFDVHIIEIGRIYENDQDVTRVVSLRVDGMSSQDCPLNVMAAVELLGNSVAITKPLTSITDPIITLSYRPTLPTISIRTIMACIAVAHSPPFKVSVHHPPTIEQLHHKIQLHERHRLLSHLLFSVVAAIPTFIIGVVYTTLVKHGNPTRAYLLEPIWTSNIARADWALLIIATPVMFYGCSTFHQKGIQEIRALWRPGSSVPYVKRLTRFGSMSLLVSLGVSVAYFSSVGILVLSASSPAHKMGNSATYFDTVVFLTMFLLAGGYLQAYSRSRTSDAISALTSLRPTEALLLSSVTTNGVSLKKSSPHEDVEKVEGYFDQETLPVSLGQNIERIPLDHLEVGDIVRIPSGSSPPADGIVMPGQSGVFDESSLTGESQLARKLPGDKVLVGTINKGQVLHVKVQAMGKKTMLDQIIQVVREGQGRKAPIERIADYVTGYFVPAMTLLAILTWVIWLSLGLSGTLPLSYLDLDIGGWTLWSLQFAIAVFVVACPCGIGLAAPTALLVGSGLAAKYGILARGGGESFQEMAQLDLIVFDKTGTLTEGGEPQVSDHEISSSILLSRSTIYGIASELESISSHPLAIAIRNFCRESIRQLGTKFEETPGRGVKAVFPELRCTAVIGNEAWMQEHSVLIDNDFSNRLKGWKLGAKSVVLLAVQEEGHESFCMAAAFAITDCVRPEAAGVISQLQQYGISTWLLSGDNFTTAAAVAASVGIPATNVIAGVLPHEKSKCIQNLQKDGPKRSIPSETWLLPRKSDRRTIVAMVGDGINDAPALAVADVGIAIGSGSDVALSSASFILLSSNLTSLLTLRDLSRRIINRIKFNFVWAIMYNMITVPLAAGVFYPIRHTRLSPVWASLAMALSSVSVVCSSLMLKVYRGPKY